MGVTRASSASALAVVHAGAAAGSGDPAPACGSGDLVSERVSAPPDPGGFAPARGPGSRGSVHAGVAAESGDPVRAREHLLSADARLPARRGSGEPASACEPTASSLLGGSPGAAPGSGTGLRVPVRGSEAASEAPGFPAAPYGLSRPAGAADGPSLVRGAPRASRMASGGPQDPSEVAGRPASSWASDAASGGPSRSAAVEALRPPAFPGPATASDVAVPSPGPTPLEAAP